MSHPASLINYVTSGRAKDRFGLERYPQMPLLPTAPAMRRPSSLDVPPRQAPQGDWEARQEHFRILAHPFHGEKVDHVRPCVMNGVVETWIDRSEHKVWSPRGVQNASGVQMESKRTTLGAFAFGAQFPVR